MGVETREVVAEPLEVELALTLYAQMIEIRHFENEVQRLFMDGVVRGTTHLCNGQEAVCVGACSALQAGDAVTCTYRGHGYVLAMGAPLDKTFGEIMGKREGLCGGKGGSMHLADLRVGVYGSFAIVGAHLPVTVGLAFASRYLDDKNIAVCFFGDGTANIGAFHEALNMAAVWKLPALFVLENNLYGEYSPLATTTPIEDLSDRAKAYAMPGVQVDGNDVFAVRSAIAEAAARARAGEGPTLLEALTYRQVGHSRSDPGNYRPAGELELWLERDPITLLSQRLIHSGVSEHRLLAINDERAERVREALARAKDWEPPSVAERFQNVLA